jgi:type VI secretion system protein ImpL
MGKIFKIVLLLIVPAALGALAFWLVAIKGKPWWFAALLLTGLIGVLAGVFFIKRYLVRGRERKFVQRVIDQDTEAIKRVPVTQRHELVELQEHWKDSVTRLQQSHLRRLGNPLYVLPWFLVMGESKTGKTSAVKNACQNTPMSQISRSSGLSGTRNCDWWFFDRAIILDTAGRYTIPLDEGPDLEEWKQFLVLLSKYRKREPLNGVIVAIAADKLIKADEAALREEGQSIRRRIDQMMRIMGAKFPVYLLMTKMDLVYGFNEFNQALTSDQVAQAMGFTNTALKVYWRDVLDAAMESIGSSLKNLRFLLAHQAETPAPASLLFPTEFEGLIPGLEMFLEAVFEENPYQETPLLRGLYFSSALRKDSPQSEFLKATGLQAGEPAAPSPGEGFFLKDFFANILPKDRHLFMPLREFILWRRLTRSLGLLSWALISLTVCGLLGLSYYHNVASINDFKKTFYDPPALCREYSTDLLMIDRLRLEILDLESKNHTWILPRFGLNQSVRMVEHLKRHYLKLFKEDFLTPLDDKVMLNIEQTAGRISEDEFVDCAGYVVAQIGVLSAHLKGKQPPQGNEFRLIAANLFTELDDKLLPEIVQKFSDGYFAYLNWDKDKAGTQAKLEEFKTALVDLIEKRGRDLRWLVHGWIPETSAVYAADFLETETGAGSDGSLYVPGAFTQEGRKHIETFIAYIEAALGEEDQGESGSTPAVADQAGVALKTAVHTENDADQSMAGGQTAAAVFEMRKKAFWGWYRQAFYQAWYDFLDRFPKDVEKIKDSTSRQRLAFLMPTEQNPYFKLLQRAGDEINSLGHSDDAPVFSDLVLRINAVRAFALKEKQTSVTEKIAFKADRLKEKIERQTDQEKARTLEENLELANAWNAYKDALVKIKIGLSSQEQGYQTYLGGFAANVQPTTGSETTSAASSSLADADYAYHKLKTMMAGKTDEPVVWDLVRGPQGFLMDLAAAQAACYLQDQWREQVLSFLEGIDPDKISRLLFDKQEGLVWKFLDKSAKPFIARSKSGYIPRRDFQGKSLPFRPEFMHLLDQGEKAVLAYQPEYRVMLETIPIGVNDDAKAEPFAAILKVSCAENKFVLENYNYPNKATIKWSPSQCGETTLSIAFTGFTLIRTYKGNLGFAAFLEEFRDGSRKFPAAAFPDRKRDLEKNGVSFITISYKISGGDTVVKLLGKNPSRMPEEIVRCDEN